MAAFYLRPWRIDLVARPGVRTPVARAGLARLAAHALTVCRAPSPASMGLILSDDRELAALNVAHELLSMKLGAGFDLGQAKRRLVALESQIDAAIAKQEKLF